FQHSEPLVEIEFIEIATYSKPGLRWNLRQHVNTNFTAINFVCAIDFTAQDPGRDMVCHADIDDVLLAWLLALFYAQRHSFFSGLADRLRQVQGHTGQTGTNGDINLLRLDADVAQQVGIV